MARETMTMSNSSLVDYTKWSPNHSGKKTHSIDRITPHCVVGQLSVETLGSIFANPDTGASCQYGIGADGRIGQYVDEICRSWCSSSNENDQRAVTIECASETRDPYAMRDCVYQSLVTLCVDICKRNGKNKLLWLGNKYNSLSYVPKSNEMVLTAHRFFANKSCPGEWLYSKFGQLAYQVTTILQGNVGEWKKDNIGWWYDLIDGSWYYSTWKQIGGEWYYFDADGYAVTGWKSLDGKWYYFNSDCKMVTGWQSINGKWYYFEPSGDMRTGWVKWRDRWYYLREKDGDMISDEFRKVGGDWYRFDASGAMLEKTTLQVGSDGAIK